MIKCIMLSTLIVSIIAGFLKFRGYNIDAECECKDCENCPYKCEDI